MGYTVYCHTNKINGKKYVGITKQKPETRWANGKGYRNQRRFSDAIEKYGWHNFTHEILYTNLPKREAEALEIALIEEYQSADREPGYNTDFGGIDTTQFGEEHRRNLSEACKGRKPSPETCAKISEHAKGAGNPMYGRSRRDEPMKTKKPVLCVETGQTYSSISDAGRKNGLSVSRISKVCNGCTQTVGGFHWKFATAGG